MKLSLYQIDAFAEKVFTGNPAAICPLTQWLEDKTMLAIAQENNLSETAFFIPTERGFHIRWFTPVTEVDLCGHATLAAAYVIFNFLDYQEDTICFESKSGLLKVAKENDLYALDFPAQPPIRCETPALILQAFAYPPIACLKAEDYIVVFEDEKIIHTLKPDVNYLKHLDLRGVIITAKSEYYDFIARFFAPKYGIDEDAVTGSAYTQLIPYWKEVLGISQFYSKQVSQRGGELWCEDLGDRVKIAGKAEVYLVGEIRI